MVDFAGRIPKNYSGTKPTGREIRELLPKLLQKLAQTQEKRPDLVLAAWPEIIGERGSALTQAVSFSDGILCVKVRNSTLLSLLSQHEKGRLLRLLKERFPQFEFRNILFRIG